MCGRNQLYRFTQAAAVLPSPPLSSVSRISVAISGPKGSCSAPCLNHQSVTPPLDPLTRMMAPSTTLPCLLSKKSRARRLTLSQREPALLRLRSSQVPSPFLLKC